MAWLLDTNAWIQFLKPGQAAGQSIANRLPSLRMMTFCFAPW